MNLTVDKVIFLSVVLLAVFVSWVVWDAASSVDFGPGPQPECSDLWKKSSSPKQCPEKPNDSEPE